MALVPRGISVPISNPFNPFTVADATIPNFFPDGVRSPGDYRRWFSRH